MKSLTRPWSAAATGRVSASTFVNQDLFAGAAAGIEYDFFPYTESSRRLLTVQYTLGFVHLDYKDTTW